MSMVTRAGTLARKTRRKSGGTAYRFGGNRYHHYHHGHHHHHNHSSSRDQRNRRASAPILTPQYPRFFRVPSPISRSAETVALPIPSPSPQYSPSKSVSFSTEVEEVLIAPRPDTLSVHTSVGTRLHTLSVVTLQVLTDLTLSRYTLSFVTLQIFILHNSIAYIAIITQLKWTLSNYSLHTISFRTVIIN
ncbi:hypothetical protein PoB_000596800 [Plakobranchus ocellatus]|uniref:Uncharacterized protein n=1 Tax=Plakobranchus ocellatus TaxID=259542 RepID=A0AAV3YBE1_9GAST|nr:hypothetical protein PoB_000596800 [Plakobranchus ocellatus]